MLRHNTNIVVTYFQDSLTRSLQKLSSSAAHYNYLFNLQQITIKATREFNIFLCQPKNVRAREEDEFVMNAKIFANAPSTTSGEVFQKALESVPIWL
jgi:hypothetical protein